MGRVGGNAGQGAGKDDRILAACDDWMKARYNARSNHVTIAGPLQVSEAHLDR